MENIAFNFITGLILLFLITVFIEYIDRFYKLVFKNTVKKYTTLNCGIFAWSSNDTKKFVKSKFDILGLYNDSRGGDGCGISKNSEIIKNIDKDKLYKDFLVNKNYDNDLENGYIIGHTRNSSKGLKNLDNTHPFGFGEDKDKGYRFIGVHNGTLYNEDEIAEKYKCDSKKNDSSILLEALYNSKSYKVLSEYMGAAALVFTDTSNPNTIFAFRGESKKFKSNQKQEEERPLYYYQESKNNVYISSLMEALIAITEKDSDIEKIHEFEANTVYEIKNGNVKKAIKTRVSRHKCYQRNYSSASNYYDTNGWGNSSINDNYTASARRARNREITNTNLNGSKNSKTNERFDVTKETLSNTERKHRGVVFENFLYKRNGHNVTGVFINTEETGLQLVDEDLVDAIQLFYINMLDKPFDKIEGIFKKSMKDINHQSYSIPFSSKIYNEHAKYPFIFIVDGVRVCNHIDFNTLVKDHYTLRKNEFINRVSWCSYYPVLDLKGEAVKNEKAIEFKRFNPLNSGYIYTIINGKVTSRRINNSDGLIEKFKSNANIVEADNFYKKVIDLNNVKDEFEDVCNILKNTEVDELNIREVKKEEKVKLFNLPSYKEEPSEAFQTLFNRVQTFHNKYLVNKKDAFERFANCEYSKNMIKAIDNFTKELEDIKTDLLIKD